MHRPYTIIITNRLALPIDCRGVAVVVTGQTLRHTYSRFKIVDIGTAVMYNIMKSLDTSVLSLYLNNNINIVRSQITREERLFSNRST